MTQAAKPLPPSGALGLEPVWRLTMTPEELGSREPRVLGSVGNWVVAQLGRQLFVLDAQDGRTIATTTLAAEPLAAEPQAVAGEWLLAATPHALKSELIGYQLPEFVERFRFEFPERGHFIAEGRVVSSAKCGDTWVFAAVNALPVGVGVYGGSGPRELIAVNAAGGLVWRKLSPFGGIDTITADASHFYVASDSAFAALNPATGAVEWTVKGTTPAEPVLNRQSAVASASAVLFVDDGRTLQRLAPESGMPVWKLELETNAVNSLIVQDGVAYALIEPRGSGGRQVMAIDTERGRVLWRKVGAGRPLNAVGPEGVTVLGKVNERLGVVLLDARSGAPRASFRVGDGNMTLARAVAADGSTWLVSSTASDEILGLRVTQRAPPAPEVTLRGRLTNGVGGPALADFPLLRDPDRPGAPYAETRTDADGNYAFTVRAADVIGITASPRAVEAFRERTRNGRRSWFCFVHPEVRYVRAGAIADGARFDFTLGCDEMLGR